MKTKEFKKYLEYCKWLGPNCNPPPLPFEKWLAMERKWGRMGWGRGITFSAGSTERSK
jgi:hypothetical protein